MAYIETIHELKIWKEYFDDVDSGKKNFEVRKLDRLFGIGDTLWLREWSPITGYSGRETKKRISYFMNGGQWGLSEGNCILGLAAQPIEDKEAKISEQIAGYIHEIDSLRGINRQLGEQLKKCTDAGFDKLEGWKHDVLPVEDKEDMDKLKEENRQLKELRKTFSALNDRLSEDLRTANGKIYELKAALHQPEDKRTYGEKGIDNVMESYEQMRQPEDKEDGWISVEDKLPENDEWVLGYTSFYSKNAFVTYFKNKIWGGKDLPVTHWQPLPAQPKASHK